MNYKPWARACLDLIFLCSAVGILAHHVLHIWETQLSEGRRSPDHWEILLLGGRHLGALVTTSALSHRRSISLYGLRVQCHPGSYAAATSAFAESAYENN